MTDAVLQGKIFREKPYFSVTQWKLTIMHTKMRPYYRYSLIFHVIIYYEYLFCGSTYEKGKVPLFPSQGVGQREWLVSSVPAAQTSRGA